MKAVVFVPGIMGTRLVASDGEELWPPRALETQFGYKRVDKLLADDVKCTEIIKSVACFDFYGTVFKLLAEVGFTETDAAQRLVPFPYDWRLDLEHTADGLAARLDTLSQDGPQDIHLVAHSMGGLITRLVLETRKYRDRPWFGKIRTFTALAVPHRGAPLALARVLGIDSSLGISKADFRRIAADPRYPSGYQLLPAPDEAACWSQSNIGLDALDIYDGATAAMLGLDPNLLARARFVHDALASGAPPPGVRYFMFAGTGHETMTRVNVFQDGQGAYPASTMEATLTEGGGDGTVPLWSALARVGQKELVVNEHAHVFQGLPFKKVFYRLFGRADLGPALEAVELGRSKTGGARLSLAKPIIECGKPFELLVLPFAPTGSLAGTLLIQRLREDGSADGPEQQLAPLHYQGPPITRLRLVLLPIPTPGLYRIIFAADLGARDMVQFAIAKIS